MKKLTLILLILLLAGCGSKKPEWSEVAKIYESVKQTGLEKAAEYEEILSTDYLSYVDEIKDLANQVEYDNDGDDSICSSLYQAANTLNALAEKSGINSKLNDLANKAMELVQASYESKEALETKKQELNEIVDSISTWDNSVWKKLEIKKYINWSSVEKQYEHIDDTFDEDMIAEDEVSEFDLEDLKDIIINGYDVIKSGVTSETDATAKEMYDAASKLRRYTKYISSDVADEVYYFCKDTQEFIKTKYQGYTSEEDLSGYYEEVIKASKYTQSVWNEIAILLRSY